MEMQYPVFTEDMKKTHTILIPNMAPVQFRILAAAMEHKGYKVELLGNCGSQVSELGLKYVHNDTCYPALLVIGQFLDALNSGKYDLEHTALIITQTGGGCRASNYIFLLRKALEKAGYGNIPVLSLNFSGLEKGNSLPMDLTFIRMALAAIYYGDLLVALKAQTSPYETHPGDAAALQEKWLDTICGWVHAGKGFSQREMKTAMPKIAAEFAAIPVRRVPKVKVGVVGEIYVKYSPLGNNDLENFLASQDCEVNLPGLQLHLSAAQGFGKGGLRQYSRAEPELLRPGKGQQPAHGPDFHAHGPGCHLLRRLAGDAEGPDGSLRNTPRRRGGAAGKMAGHHL